MRFRTTIIMLFAAVLLVLAMAACSPPVVTEAPVESSGAAVAPIREKESASLNGPEGCMPFNAIPAPNPTQAALFPPRGADDHIKGPAEASVTIIEYSDFQ